VQRFRTEQKMFRTMTLAQGLFGGKLGITELLLILAIALIFFGPSKLGDLGKGLGDAIKNFKGAMKEHEHEPSGQPTPPADKK
jgi:sec-independent protein translocase protein TatA